MCQESKLRTVTCKLWRNVLCWFMTGPVMSQLWTRPGLISLPESKENMTWSHQPKQHSKSTPNVLLMRLDTCGDKHWSDVHKCLAHPTGDGWNRTRSGKSSGLHFHLLQRVVGSWPNVCARRHVLEDVSASDMDSVAQAYVVAPARICMFLLPELFLCVFRCSPMARLPLATSAHHVLLSHQPITVKLSVVTL